MRKNTNSAKRLRRNQTDAERVLWFHLRDRRLAGLKFKRQVPINRFIVDFYCASGKLILEIDGGQHDLQNVSDTNRTKILESKGYLVLRFWNNDFLKNTIGVLEAILSTINQRGSEPPHPNPLPDGERELTEPAAPASVRSR